ncbi:unnamed protein product [Blepharisma stoltei]|uniref:Uncharacterized protein n=1 Tax=Blepharisma stoltei TaxID=1481888 RepID=A0AAU9JR77_9CILI|nr:unnamed protein product [Blepharisma stoltei]
MQSQRKVKAASDALDPKTRKIKTSILPKISHQAQLDYLDITSTTQEPSNCVFCKRSTPTLLQLPASIFINIKGLAHKACIESKGCFICGESGLLYQCSIRDCSQFVHKWCSIYHHFAKHDVKDDMLHCDIHNSGFKRKDSYKYPNIRNQCKKILYSRIWQSDYKQKDSPASLCNGYILWYIIGVEYFPQGFNLSSIPEFPLMSGASLDYISFSLKTKPKPAKSPSFIDSLIKYYDTEHKNAEKELQPIIQEIQDALFLKDKTKKNSGISEEKIHAELAKLDLGTIQQDYMHYFEESALTLSSKENGFSSLGLRKNLEKTQNEGCWVCSENTNEEADPLIKCVKCGMEVHMKCYGISEKINDWVCEPCLLLSPDRRTLCQCALCPKPGGALKKTVHINNNSNHFPNYSPLKLNKGKTDNFVWVHVFCALRVEKVHISSPSKLEEIDISKINNICYSSICEVCKTTNGACVFCSFKGCIKAFHPECGKDHFATKRGFGKHKIYCALHKPLQLRKMLETRQKKVTDDIFKFYKAIEKWEQNANTATQRGIKRKREKKLLAQPSKIFTTIEDQNLEFKIQKYLHKLNVGQNRPFFIHINLTASTRKSRVDVDRPQYFTLIHPEVILEESIAIEKRTPEECFKRYQDTLYTRIKNDILLRGDRLSIYYGQSIMPGSLKKVRPAGNRNSYKGSHQKSQAKKLKKLVPKPVISKDTYCYCNKPFYYQLPWLPEWSQEEYETKIKENEMIECPQCERWFHFGCIGYVGTLEQAQCDEDWLCNDCSLKKQKAIEMSTTEE